MNWIFHTCGQQGHVAKYCSSKKHVNFVNMINCVKFLVTVSVVLKVNGEPLRCLVDTGSSVCLINASVVWRLRLTSKRTPKLCLIKGVTGHKLNILGTCNVRPDLRVWVMYYLSLLLCICHVLLFKVATGYLSCLQISLLGSHPRACLMKIFVLFKV